jgi:uncharacterized membrane protein YraQ (UPF0718 family)
LYRHLPTKGVTLFSVGLLYLAVIATVYLIAGRISPDKTRESLRVARFSLLRILPLLVAVFTLIGLFQTFLPPEIVQNWLGETSGKSSLLVGGLAGAVAIGPPLAAFPLAGSLLEAGAWPPAIAAFIVSWISVGIITLPFEASVFGPRFALARNSLAFLSSLLIGLLAGSFL